MRPHLGKLAAAGLLLVAVPVTSVGAKFASKSDSGAAVYVRDDASCTPLQDNTIENGDDEFYAVIKYNDTIATDVTVLDYSLKDKNGQVSIVDNLASYCDGPYAVIALSGANGRLGSYTLIVNYPNGKTFANNSFRFVAP